MCARSHPNQGRRSDDMHRRHGLLVPRVQWGMFWAGLAAVTRGAAYVVPHQVVLPSVIDQMPDYFLHGMGAIWLVAGIWALVAAFTGRFSNRPAQLVAALCVAWAGLYLVAMFYIGVSAFSGFSLYVIVAGLILTKSRVVLISVPATPAGDR